MTTPVVMTETWYVVEIFQPFEEWEPCTIQRSSLPETRRVRDRKRNRYPNDRFRVVEVERTEKRTVVEEDPV